MTRSNTKPLTAVSVVVPAYNEERRLAGTLRSVITYLDSTVRDWELIIVDDGSGDDTLEIAHRFAKEYSKQVRVLHQAINQGKGAAVRQGVLAASTSVIAMIDADQATPMSELPKLVAKLAVAPVVIGSRYLPGSTVVRKQSLVRRVLSRAGNVAIRLGLRLPFTDTQCGFKVMTRAAGRTIFEQLTILRWGFDIEMLAIARAAGLPVAEVPVIWHDRGNSKLRAGRAAWSTLQDLWQIRANVQNDRYGKIRNPKVEIRNKS